MESTIIFDYDKKQEKYYIIRDYYNNSIKEYMIDNDIKGILISKYHGFNMPNIDFIKELDFIEDLRFIDVVPKDNSILNILNKLTRLILAGEFMKNVDFNNFPDLEECSLYWNSKVVNFFHLKRIKSLIINKYVSSSDHEFFKLEQLEYLKIAQSSISNINDFLLLRNLKVLELVYLRNLISIEFIEKLINLEKLIIANCPKLENYWSNILGLKNIRWIGLSKLQQIESLGNLENLQKLEYLAIIEGIKIIDGNTNPLLNLSKLKSLSLQNFSFYNKKSWEIESQLKTNN